MCCELLETGALCFEIVELLENETWDMKEFISRLNVVSTQGKDDEATRHEELNVVAQRAPYI